MSSNNEVQIARCVDLAIVTSGYTDRYVLAAG